MKTKSITISRPKRMPGEVIQWILPREAMLFYDLYTGKDLYTSQVSDIMELRNRKPSDTVSYRSQPFCSYNYALYKATGNEDYVNPYVCETRRMMKR